MRKNFSLIVFLSLRIKENERGGALILPNAIWMYIMGSESLEII